MRRVILCAALAVLPAAPAAAWGPIVHQAVNERAIETLPSPLKGFYKDHRLELPSLAPDANFPEEGPERRFAVDRLLGFPFAELPASEPGFQSRYGAQGEGVGRLPWLLLESYARLTEAFKSRDKARILAESDTLATLVTDLHNPLALSDNADGQKTGQPGLWLRFSQRFPEAVKAQLKLDPDAAHYLDDPRDYVFSILRGSYVWLDNVLYFDDLARRGKAGYSEIYFEALSRRAGGLLRQRLSLAAGDVGSYWYTAWTAAGRPELK